MFDPDHLRDLFARFGPISIRNMFGGQGIYAEGRMFALTAFGELYFKVDGENRAAFEAAGGKPFVYEGKAKTATMQYWTIPDADMDDPDAIARWARLSAGAAFRAATKVPKKPKR
jgi:DNA transformation protein and related proteins